MTNTSKEITAKKTDADIQSIVKAVCEEAIDHIESNVSETRNKCQRYYEGRVDIGYESGTSKVVATKVRDTIRVILPNLMRIFLASEKPVEFVPSRPDQVQATEQATEYICREFERLGGYNILYQAVHDAVVKKAGFVKCYWKDYADTDVREFSNISDEELVLITEQPNVEVVETETVTDEQTGVSYHNITVEVTKEHGEICLETIPPEDFFIDEAATCFDDALVYGHQCEMRVSDLVEMGFDYEEVSELGMMTKDETSEKYERAHYSGNDDNFTQDPSQKLVTVTECYMQMDMDGTGKAHLYRFLLGGSEYKVLEKEKWSDRCIHKFECDPIPHLFFGNSYPELLFEDQDAATSMLRGVLNNIAQTNIPRTEVDDSKVNLDDLMNNEIGGIVRVTQMGNINPLTVPFIAGSVLPAMQYYDLVIEAKSGVNNLSSGLNPELLQGTSATAVNAVTAASANQLEAIARHLAQGGMCDLFRHMLQLTVDNVSDEVFMRQEGNEFQAMQPSTWAADYDMTVNVGLGTGQEAQKVAALSNLILLQKEAAMTSQTAVTPDNIRNTIADILAINGIHNVDRYWPQQPPVQPQPQQQQGPDPYVQAEQIKAQSRLQEAQMRLGAEQQQKMADMQLRMAELSAKDDLERDKMAQDLMVDFANILGQYGTQVDVEKVRQLQAAPRPAPGIAQGG